MAIADKLPEELRHLIHAILDHWHRNEEDALNKSLAKLQTFAAGMYDEDVTK